MKLPKRSPTPCVTLLINTLYAIVSCCVVPTLARLRVEKANFERFESYSIGCLSLKRTSSAHNVYKLIETFRYMALNLLSLYKRFRFGYLQDNTPKLIFKTSATKKKLSSQSGKDFEFYKNLKQLSRGFALGKLEIERL